jgi:tetratricopeptide (TPR) repeat protein
MPTAPRFASLLSVLTLSASLALAQGPTPTPAAAQAATTPMVQGAFTDLVLWETNRAQQKLDEAQETVAATPEYRTARALLQAQRGQTDDALRMLVDAAKAAPSLPQPEFYRGEILYWKKQQTEAAKAWQAAADRAARILQADPASTTANYYRGAALVRLQRGEDARKALQAAEANGFDKTLTTYQRGLSYFVEGQWQKARESFDAALQLEPRFAYAYFYRGLAWSKLGRSDAMINDLDQFLKLAPSAPDAPTAKALLSAYRR